MIKIVINLFRKSNILHLIKLFSHLSLIDHTNALFFDGKTFQYSKKQHLHSLIPIGVQIRVRIWRRANIIAITPLITVCSCQGNQATTRYTFSREIRVRECTYDFFHYFFHCVKKKLERASSRIRTVLNELTKDKSRGNENSIRVKGINLTNP